MIKAILFDSGGIMLKNTGHDFADKIPSTSFKL